MAAEAGNSEVRRRVVTTLYSSSRDAEEVETAATLPGRPGEAPGESPPGKEAGREAVSGGLETKVKEVTQGMFSSMLNGLSEDVITKENLDKAIQNLFTTLLDPSKSLAQSPDYAASSRGTKSALKRLLLDAIYRSPTQQVDCALFGDVALRCIQGDLSLFDLRKIAIEHKDLIADNKHASIGSMMMDPIGSSRKMYQSLLRWIEKQGVKWLWSSFSTKQMYWLIAAYVLPMLTVSFIISSVSTALFVGAMIAMVLTTIEIAVDSEKSQFQAEYLALVQYFNKGSDVIKPGLSGPTFIKYANFVVALVVALISLEFSYIHPALYSLLFLGAFIAVSFVTLQYDLHEHAIFFYFCLAKLPGLVFAILYKIQAYIPFSQYFTFLFHPFIEISLSDDLSVHLDLVTVLQVSLHVYSLIACYRSCKLSDLLDIIGPLGLLVCWYEVLRFFLAKSSAAYITTLVVASCFVTVVSPLVALFFLVSPMIFLYFYGFTPPFFYSCGFVLLAGTVCCLVAISWNYFPSFWLNLSLDYAFLMGVAISIPFAVYLSSWYASLYVVPPLPVVTMDEYNEYCSHLNYQQMNSVQAQINCLHLQGRVLNGKGTVNRVTISRVTDTKAASLHFLPSSLQRALTCVLGETEPMCGNLDHASTCVSNGCHFHSSLQYTFEVKMYMRLGEHPVGEAKMSVPDQYRAVMLSLEHHSVVRFNATLVEGMGTDLVVLHALHVTHDGVEVPGEGSSEGDENEGSFENFLQTFLKALLKTVVMVVDMFFGLLH